MNTRSSYRSLPRVAGPGLLITAFLARLPAAMAPLGLIVLVSSVTGSLARAGLATAALGIGAAAGGPVVGWLTDQLGQRVIGLAAAITNAAALAATAVVVLAGGGMVATAVLAAVAAFASPQVGPLSRVRWATLLPRRGHAELLPTAMAYEGGVDEASYVAGPAIVGLLTLIGPPALPLAATVALTLGAAVPFAMHPTANAAASSIPTAGSAAVGTVPARRTQSTGNWSSRSAPLPVAALAVLGIVMAAIGLIFGATQTGITALAESIGHAGTAGLIYAVLGLGSATSGLATGWLPARFTLPRRLSVFAVVLFAGSLMLLAIRGLSTATIAMLVLGVAVAPLLVTAYAVAERIAPPARIGTVITLLASATVAGVALGAGVGGLLAQAYGFTAALAVPAFAGALALIAATAGRRHVRDAQRVASDRREIAPQDTPTPAVAAVAAAQPW